MIDRRFYRRKYDAQKTLAAFSASLQNEVDLAHLREQMLVVVEETMQPKQISLWLREPDRDHPNDHAYRLEPHSQVSTKSGLSRWCSDCPLPAEYTPPQGSVPRPDSGGIQRNRAACGVQ